MSHTSSHSTWPNVKLGVSYLLFAIYLVLGAFIFRYLESETEVKEGNEDNWKKGWDYSKSLFFCVAVVTSIGYGDSVPMTYIGKLSCMVYALFGIPLCFNVAGQVATAISRGFCELQQFFVNLNCKRASAKADDTEDPDADPTAHARNIRILITITIVLLIFIFAIGSAVLLDHFEDWGLYIAVWYTFISWSTIGFGDKIAGYKEAPFADNFGLFVCYRGFLFIWTLFGIGVAALILRIINRKLEACLNSIVNLLVCHRSRSHENLHHEHEAGTLIAECSENDKATQAGGSV